MIEVAMSKLLQKYLRFAAKIYLKRAKPKIVAVTGSVGKTSTKEAIFEVLRIKFKNTIRKSEGNLNNETGAPMAILGYKNSPANVFAWLPIILTAIFRAIFLRIIDVLVLELAADKPGDIEYLTQFIKPDVAVITNIGPAHLEAFETLEKIVEEKMSLLKALPEEGSAVFNVDDEYLNKYSRGEHWDTLTYAIQNEAEVMAKNITTEINDLEPQTKFQINHEQEKYRVEIHTLGRVGNVYAALAAAAVGIIFELNPQDIIQGLGNIKNEKHRMEVVRGKNNSIILDDCYNANPASMKMALDILRNLPDNPAPFAGGRKIAVLGGMREIGKITDEAHKLIGEYAQTVADEVVAVGQLAQKYNAKKYFDNPAEASAYLLSKISSSDIILIKASRAVGLEKIVEALRE